MDLRNMGKLPPKVQKVLKPYLERLQDIYKDSIISIFAYGSVTGPDYNPGTSDINVAIVLNDTSTRILRSALETVRSGIRKKINAPLFLTPAYIKMSLDTFPMEFMSMKDTRLVFFGDDILADITVEKEDLRRECEYQLKGKLLTIRQAYLEQALNRKALEKLIKMSLRALFPVFQNMLRMRLGGQPPLDKAEILRRLSEEFKIDVSSFARVLHDTKTDGHIGGQSAELFIDAFLAQLESLSRIVDNM